jgi:hypothetical protein
MPLLLLLTGACTRDSVIYGQCSTIYDCRTGQACSEKGHCEPGAAPPAGAYGVELLPATNSGTGPVRNELSQLTLGGGDVALDFQEPVVLEGRIILDSSSQAQPSVGAAVTVTRTSRIGLTDATYSVEAVAGKADGQAAFSLRLPPTKTASDEGCLEEGNDCYQVRVVPTDLGSYPPLVQAISLATSKSVPFGLNSLDLAWVHGTVKDATLNGLAGVEVRAVDGDGRTVSSVVTTSSADGKVGEFGLSLSSAVAEKKVWLQVSATDATPNVPRFLYEFTAGGGEPMDLGDVVLLAFQAPVTVTYRVKATASNGQSELVEGAQVRFTTFLSDVFPVATPSDCPTATCAVYSRQGTSDANGEVTLTLIPGAYEVEVLPGPNSPYSAMHQGDVEVGQGGVAADLALDRKVEIRGTVIDYRGQPVAGATVAAGPRALTLPDDGVPGTATHLKTADLALEESPSSGQTDDSGQFLLMLEPGVSYDIVVTPSASSPDPITTLLGQEFETAGTFDIQLPEAALLAGTVATWDDSDTAGTLVRIYELVPTGVDGEGFTAWLRGQAVTTTGGTFKILLPSGPATKQ